MSTLTQHDKNEFSFTLVERMQEMGSPGASQIIKNLIIKWP